MKDIYLVSGLGADHRVFEKLDLGRFRVHPIRWITPDPDERIENYARRLAGQITTPNPLLIGVSFGGMIAIEIGKQFPAEKIILISTVRTRHELPLWFRLMGKSGINKSMPEGKFKAPESLSDWFFSVTKPEEKELLHSILRDTDPHFSYWAVDQLLNWQNTVIPANTVLIQGTKDRLLPNKKNADYMIKGGGHLMILNRAKEIDSVLRDIIAVG